MGEEELIENLNREKFTMIPIELLVYSGRNPRTEMKGIEELAENIGQYGIIQPIIVRPQKEKSEVVVGERRVRAAIMAGLKEVPAIIKALSDRQTDEIRLIENIHREDLTDAEKGDGVYALLENYPDKYPTIKSVADTLDKSYGSVNGWTIKSRKLSEFVKQQLIGRLLGEKQALGLIKYNHTTQDKLAGIIIDNGLTQRETSRLLKLYDENPLSDLDNLIKEVKGTKKVEISLEELPKDTKKEIERLLEEKREKTKEARKEIYKKAVKASAKARKEKKKIQERQKEIAKVETRKEFQDKKTKETPISTLHSFIEETKPLEIPKAGEISRSGETMGESKKIEEGRATQTSPEGNSFKLDSINLSKEQLEIPNDLLPSERDRLESVLKGQISKIMKVRTQKNQKRLMPMVNILNELSGDEWLKFTKSWYAFDALESDLEEERAITIDVEDHPATFSPTMISEYVRFFTKKEETVLDPFVGIGSALVACMRAGRKGIGIDINEEYIEITKKRIKEDSRQKAICGDAWNIEKYGLPIVDYCITSPPYFSMLEKIDVTQRKRMEKGLDVDYGDAVILPKDVNEYINRLVELFCKVAKLTKEGGYLTVILQNFRDKKKMIPLAWKFAIALDETKDWIFKGEKIWCQSHKKLHPFGYPSDWVSNVHHHYCLIFRRK